jgi:poly(3-hydroxybutyrate) depolymerase
MESDWQLSLPFGGRTRSFLVHVPPQAATAALPVVVNFHGAPATPSSSGGTRA